MRSASLRQKRTVLLVILSVTLTALAAAAALAGNSPSGVARAEGDDLAVEMPTAVAETVDGDGVVATTDGLQQLGTSLGLITPTWVQAAATADDDRARDVVATGLRTLYTAGRMANEGSEDVYLAKYVDEARAWERVYDGPAHGFDGALAVAARGSRVYTAGMRDPKGDDHSDVLLIRWSSTGDRVWARSYDSGDHQYDRALDVAVDGDGNIVVAGVSYRYATGLDWVVISYRPDGTRRWVRRYDGPSHLNDVPAKMLIDSKDRIYIAGYSTSGRNGTDVLLAKYSQSGTRLWAKRFNGSADGADEATSLCGRPGGGVYVCGSSTATTTAIDGLLLAYSSAGSRLFTAVEDAFTGDSRTQVFKDLAVMRGGDIVCGGYGCLSGSDPDLLYVVFYAAGAVCSVGASSTEWDEEYTAATSDRQGGVYLTGTWGTATGTQVFTRRLCPGGSDWVSRWPSYPTTDWQPMAIATNGVNAYVVGTRGDDAVGYDQFVTGHVY